MNTRILTLFMVAMMVPMLATVVSAQDESYIVVNGSGAFALDENNDGNLDLVRVIGLWWIQNANLHDSHP